MLPSIDETLRLAMLYSQRKSQSELIRTRNYIREPKEDGYRSIHLVYKYNSDREQYKAFNGHRIEIQIRSQLQHAWATAVEMLWTFAKIPLRLAPGQIVATTPRSVTEIGKWRRLFALMGSAMAIRENMPVIPGVPFDKFELSRLASELNVQTLLPTWNMGVAAFLGRKDANASQFLLQLDSDKKIQIRAFLKDQTQEAFNAYMYAEQSSPPTDWGEPPSTNVVLVSVDSLAELRSAYPNYYGDTKAFVEALRDAIA